MNHRTHLTTATFAAALLATALMLHGQPVLAAQPAAATAATAQPVPMRVVQLPRVEVVGHRLPVAQPAPMRVVMLPRVEVVGHRLEAPSTRLVQASAVKPAAKPV